MNPDVFNIELRKFLKRVGVTSQREIEQAVQRAVANGSISGDEVLKVEVVLRIEQLGLHHTVEGEIKLK